MNAEDHLEKLEKLENLEKRQSCDICISEEKNCQIVSTIFARKSLNAGYHYMATIPAGACDIAIVEKKNTPNFLGEFLA